MHSKFENYPFSFSSVKNSHFETFEEKSFEEVLFNHFLILALISNLKVRVCVSNFHKANDFSLIFSVTLITLTNLYVYQDIFLLLFVANINFSN